MLVLSIFAVLTSRIFVLCQSTEPTTETRRIWLQFPKVSDIIRKSKKKDQKQLTKMFDKNLSPKNVPIKPLRQKMFDVPRKSSTKIFSQTCLTKTMLNYISTEIVQEKKIISTKNVWQNIRQKFVVRQKTFDKQWTSKIIDKNESTKNIHQKKSSKMFDKRGLGIIFIGYD